MPQTKPIISIENVVASATVDQKMDLNDITKKFPDVEYHPDQFPGLVFRLKSPKTATLIFTSGKMVCTGAKSEQMSKNAVKTVVEKLRKGKKFHVGVAISKGEVPHGSGNFEICKFFKNFEKFAFCLLKF